MTKIAKEKTFEVCMGELEKIISQLEKGDLPLEESMKLYELGVKLAGDCEIMLKNAKLKIEELGENND